MLKILRRADGELSEVATYEGGAFAGNDRLADGLEVLEGMPEGELLRSLDGPDVVAVRPTDTEAMANRYQEGDIVTTPDRGVGVIAGAVAEDQSAPADTDLPDIEASPDSPTYVVVTEDDADRGMGLYKASDLEATDIETEVDALDSTQEMAQAAALSELAPADSTVAELDFTMPASWRESDTPARIIALKAFSGMGGSFDGCVREMRGAVASPDRFCGAFLDEVLGYPHWRGDSPLPGD